MKALPYQDYKDTGLEWLGQIPEHWKLRRLGQYFDERREKVNDVDFPPLSVTKSGIVPQLETAAKSDAGDNRKRAAVGDFVINSRSDRKGSSGVSVLDGSVSLISIVLQPRDIDPKFVHHLLRSYPFQEEFYRFGKGIVADLWSTNYSEMKNINLPIPSPEEQTQIANFLDRETAKIDTLIEKQQQLIKLLREKRQAVISHAVTKGLNPNAKMKDSGVEWLGHVPEHWKVLNHRRVIATLEQGWSPQADSSQPSGEQWGVTKLSSVKSGTFHKEECKTMLDEHDPSKGLRVNNGDFLLTRANTTSLVGDVCVVSGLDQEKIILCDLIYRLKYHGSIDANFMSLLFQSDYGRCQIMMDARGSSMTMAKISQEHIKSWVIALPPKKEQTQITELVESTIGKLGFLVEKSLGAIDLLKERRTALISAAVTGKIDVRNAA